MGLPHAVAVQSANPRPHLARPDAALLETRHTGVDSLLGTPIGKTVTCVVFGGGWGRGTRRIPQIVRHSSPTGYNAYMRFDIEAILWAKAEGASSSPDWLMKYRCILSS